MRFLIIPFGDNFIGIQVWARTILMSQNLQIQLKFTGLKFNYSFDSIVVECVRRYSSVVYDVV